MAAKRKAMGSDPVKNLHPLADLEATHSEAAESISRPKRLDSKSGSSRGEFERVIRERFTVNLPIDIIGKERSAVYYTLGETLSSLTERALRKEIERLEKQRGEPFPEDEERKLSAGRPIRLR